MLAGSTVNLLHTTLMKFGSGFNSFSSNEKNVSSNSDMTPVSTRYCLAAGSVFENSASLPLVLALRFVANVRSCWLSTVMS